MDNGTIVTYLPGLGDHPRNDNTSNQTDVFNRYTFTELIQVHLPITAALDRYVTIVWYIIGIIGNFLSAKIWLEQRMRKNNSSAIYLATLALSDLLFLCLHPLQELKYAWGYRTLKYPGVCEGYFLIYLVPQYLTPLLVLGFTIERYIAVCHPFRKEKYCTVHRAVIVSAGLVTFSILLCAVQSYFWTYNYENDSCEIRPAVVDGEPASFWTIWTWVTEMLIFALVPITVLLFNVLVIREVRKLSSAGQAMLPGQMRQTAHAGATTTVMLLCVSFYLICTTLPGTIVYALTAVFENGDTKLTDEQMLADPAWQSFFTYWTVRKILEEICLSHYACNFFIYLITGVQFRKALIDTMRCILYRCKHAKQVRYAEVSQRGTHTCNPHNTLTSKV